MDRFVSNFTNKLDAKGRVSLPASFRAVLARDGFEGLYVHRSLDGPTLDCGGNALLAEVDAMMALLPHHSAERDTVATVLLGESEILKIDGEGRLILTEGLKRHADIGAEAVFVGAGQKFQIWEPGRFEARRLEARQQARNLRARLSSQSVAGGNAPPRVPEARE